MFESVAVLHHKSGLFKIISRTIPVRPYLDHQSQRPVETKMAVLFLKQGKADIPTLSAALNLLNRPLNQIYASRIWP